MSTRGAPPPGVASSIPLARQPPSPGLSDSRSCVVTLLGSDRPDELRARVPAGHVLYQLAGDAQVPTTIGQPDVLADGTHASRHNSSSGFPATDYALTDAGHGLPMVTTSATVTRRTRATTGRAHYRQRHRLPIEHRLPAHDRSPRVPIPDDAFSDHRVTTASTGTIGSMVSMVTPIGRPR